VIKLETLKNYLQIRINGLHITPHYSIANEYVKGYQQALKDIIKDLNDKNKHFM